MDKLGKDIYWGAIRDGVTSRTMYFLADVAGDSGNYEQAERLSLVAQQLACEESEAAAYRIKRRRETTS